jgi:hypothetical protein
MSETSSMKIAAGDKVRVHFHPPGPWKSFSEGVVRRVDVTTSEGRFFVLEVQNEVLLYQPHRIRPDFHDYVRYEDRNDFPGRIEVLSENTKEADESSVVNSMPHHQPEIEPSVEAELTPDLYQVEVEAQPVPKRVGLMATLFGRNR